MPSGSKCWQVLENLDTLGEIVGMYLENLDMLREFLGCIEGSSELRAYDKPGSMRG